MLKHYLIVALRNLIKYKTQTIISIIGLAVGLVSFALSGMWLHYEPLVRTTSQRNRYPKSKRGNDKEYYSYIS